MCAEAANRAFFDGDEEFMLACQAQNEFGIEWLCEARIGDRGRNPVCRKSLSGFHAFG